VDEGVVLCKDGALLAGFEYRGPDLGSATGAELNALATSLNDTLLPLGDGWMVHVDAVRAPAPPPIASAFPDPVAAWIDAERRAAFASAADVRPQFVSTYVLTVTYLPPRELYTRAAGAFLQRAAGDVAPAGQASAADVARWRGLLDGFRSALRTFEERLSGRLHVHRLDSGRAGDAPAPLPDRARPPGERALHGAYLNGVLASQELVGGHAPRIGRPAPAARRRRRVPGHHGAGRFDFLNALPFAYRWSSRFVPVSPMTGARSSAGTSSAGSWAGRGSGAFLREVTGSPDPVTADRRDRQGEALFYDQDATAMARDAAAPSPRTAPGGALRVGHAGGRRRGAGRAAGRRARAGRPGGATGSRLHGAHRVRQRARRVPGHAAGARHAQPPAAGALDGERGRLLPMTSVWPGPERNPSPFFPPASPPLMTVATDGSTPFRLNLHVSDTSHTLLVGAPGSGKSAFVGLVAAQWRRYEPTAGARTFIFDVGYSHWMLCRAVGGRHYDVAAGRVDALAFQPLATWTPWPSGRGPASWLETLLEQQGVEVGLVSAPASTGRSRYWPSSRGVFRTLTELTVQLQEPTLVEALRPYTVAGSYGRLLDAGSDALDEDAGGACRATRCSSSALLDLDDRILVPNAALPVPRVERALDGPPTLIVIEELWAPLMRTRSQPHPSVAC
jgi:type IV secretion system protein VirB4